MEIGCACGETNLKVFVENMGNSLPYHIKPSDNLKIFNDLIENGHYVKSAQIQSFFWSVSSRIWTEYGEIRRISPYSVRMRENTDQEKLRIWTLSTQWVASQIKFLMLFLMLHEKKKLFRINFVDWKTNDIITVR